MQQIKEQVQEWTRLLPTGKIVSPSEAEYRAGEFLVALAHVAEWIHSLRENKIKNSSVATAVFAFEMQRCDSKQVTEKKAYAEASKDYIAARENVEFGDNDISYLKAYQEIFTNAHVFYRQLSKEAQG
jgi:hypothetical protein